MEFSLVEDTDFHDNNDPLPLAASTSSQNLNSAAVMDEDYVDDNYETRPDEKKDSLSKVPQPRICDSDYKFCFSLWRQIDNETRVVKQGCWKESTEQFSICNRTACTSSTPTLRNNSLYYCCCAGNLCNQNVSVVDPFPLLLAEDVRRGKKLNDQPNSTSINPPSNQPFSESAILLTTCIFVVGFTILMSAFASYYFFHCEHMPTGSSPEEAPLAPAGPGYSSNMRNVDNINLISMLGSGKYGTVMKGLLNDEEVAVKIFAEHNYEYYLNERNIYSLPLMDCPALLHYFGYDERHTLEGKREFHLVLSLAPLGCLQDYLMEQVLDFETFGGMITTITRGLSHLHTPIKSEDDRKPCIAHRDFNTRNILVKADLTCCLADFGFAMKLWGSHYEYKGEKTCTAQKSIHEVGTLRYMAPELLDGAVNLRDCETSLKTVDVYALGLVLWELSTRCKDLYECVQQVVPYMSPYQQEVGLQPSYDQMHGVVVRRKLRPTFPAGWGIGDAIEACKVLRDTCEECWDHDAEARLTSLCAEQRMIEVSTLQPLKIPTNLLVEYTQPPIVRTNACMNLRALGGSTSTTDSTPNMPESDDSANRTLYPNVVIINDELCPQARYFSDVRAKNPRREKKNLPPIHNRSPKRLIECIKNPCFQNHDNAENNLKHFEYDIETEELMTDDDREHLHSSKNSNFSAISSMDRNYGWNSVRALIEKKLFRTDSDEPEFMEKVITTTTTTTTTTTIAYKNYNDYKYTNEKSHSVAQQQVQTKSKRVHERPTSMITHINSNELLSCESIAFLATTSANRRPNNLDLSPNMELAQLRSSHTYIGTPAHVQILPRSFSNNVMSLMNNSMLNNYQIHDVDNDDERDNSAENVKRQQSLEVFREVFVQSTGSLEKLRNPSQRVKTPGDVPASVRKMRATKALSLYDDRMMDSSHLNTL